MTERYAVLKGITIDGDDGEAMRFEPGEELSGASDSDTGWLLEQGAIEPLEPAEEPDVFVEDPEPEEGAE